MANIFTLLRTKLGAEFLGYFAASAIALAVDIFLLLLLAKVMHPIVAATIAFFVGLLVCYGLTVRFVFTSRRFGAQRAMEASVFFLVGLVGLGVNDIVIYYIHIVLMAHLATSKVVAAAISFIFNFMCRKCFLFTAAKRPG